MREELNLAPGDTGIDVELPGRCDKIPLQYLGGDAPLPDSRAASMISSERSCLSGAS
jgi:hypothetical protein